MLDEFSLHYFSNIHFTIIILYLSSPPPSLKILRLNFYNNFLAFIYKYMCHNSIRLALIKFV
jgi:hypothetical protein